MAPRATGSPIGDGTGGTKVINCCRHTPEAPTSTSGRQAACSRICITIRLEANYQALNAPLTRQNNSGRNWVRTSDPYRVKVTSFPKMTTYSVSFERNATLFSVPSVADPICSNRFQQRPEGRFGADGAELEHVAALEKR